MKEYKCVCACSWWVGDVFIGERVCGEGIDSMGNLSEEHQGRSRATRFFLITSIQLISHQIGPESYFLKPLNLIREGENRYIL